MSTRKGDARPKTPPAPAERVVTTADLSELMDDVITGLMSGTMDAALAGKLIGATNSHIRIAALRQKCGVSQIAAGEVVLVRRRTAAPPAAAA